MSSKKVPIVAIVGRANVGKSSLFNAILEKREAIVAHEAGTTRDSIMAKASWRGQDFWLVDTAGIKDAEDDFEFTIQEQIQQAAESADVIWVLVEADIAVTDEDRRVAKMALKSRKPVFLVINKVDKARKQHDLQAFERLGVKIMLQTSTTQGRGIGVLLDTLIEQIPEATITEDDDRIRVALLGRPNVGKSSLFNSLSKKQQAIVADRAGTTRDINRSIVRFNGREVEIMDTAGIRRPGKVGTGIEHFSVIRALSAIEQADVCMLLMDAHELNVGLDQKIAGLIKEAGKGLILVVSKWDDVEKDAYTREVIAPQIGKTYDFVPWAPLIFTSAVTGQNVTKLFELVMQITERRAARMTTSELNRWLRESVDKHPPAGLKNRLPKLNYVVQEDDNDIPAFKIFGSHTKFLHWSYKRFLEREFRERYSYEGSAIQFWFIEKHETHKHGNSPTKEPRKNKPKQSMERIQEKLENKRARKSKGSPAPKKK
jgi:GTP-binding protein